PQGVRGSSGEPGVDGETGESGLAGHPGAEGSEGSPGLSGQRGRRGRKGRKMNGLRYCKCPKRMEELRQLCADAEKEGENRSGIPEKLRNSVNVSAF
ncbi:collagen triple helix repeat protein, partial [Ostertagia ostertagi]